MMTTNPRELPVAFLLVPAFLIFGSLYVFFASISTAKLALHPQVRWAKRLKPLLLALIGTLVLLLQSLGQLTVKDLLLLGFFGILLSLYLRRTTNREG